MCTVSWTHRPGGYHLLCNRDEKRTRRAGSGPAVIGRGRGSYIAPADGDFGGTWIAVNSYGVGLCLLNGSAAAPAREKRSRGLLIPELIGARSVDECELRLGRMDLADFAPFSLALLEPGRAVSLVAWDGARKVAAAGGATGTLTSSSFDPAGVQRARLEELARHAGQDRADPANLYRFHSSHGEAASAYSPCMHRDDAETVSFSWVVVNAREVRFLYLPAAPCQCRPGEQRILARAA